MALDVESAGHCGLFTCPTRAPTSWTVGLDAYIVQAELWLFWSKVSSFNQSTSTTAAWVIRAALQYSKKRKKQPIFLFCSWSKLMISCELSSRGISMETGQWDVSPPRIASDGSLHCILWWEGSGLVAYHICIALHQVCAKCAGLFIRKTGLIRKENKEILSRCDTCCVRVEI